MSPRPSKKAKATRRGDADEHFVAHAEGIDYGVLDELIGYAIRRAQIVIYEQFTDAVGDPTVTPQRFAMLVIVGANPGMPQAHIAHVMGIARPGATALIDYWEERGCLERRRGEVDRRSFGIYLTAQGKQELAGLQSVVKKHDEKILSNLSETERKRLFGLLEKLGVAEN